MTAEDRFWDALSSLLRPGDPARNDAMIAHFATVSGISEETIREKLNQPEQGMTAFIYDPQFWEAFFENLPPLDEVKEERMIAALAKRTGLSKDRIIQRKRDYLAACMAETTMCNSSDAIH